MSPSGRGRVYLVGAGPGDPDLITLRAARLLAEADVVLHDELAAPELLDLTKPDAVVVNVGKRGHAPPSRPQTEIDRLLVEGAQEGLCVVRLKGGDPFVFGRGGEEASACARAGIPFEIVPGVSSAIAVPAYAGIPVTDRRHAASFAVVTGHKDPSQPARATRWRALATAVDTVVILMGMRNLPELAKQMIQGGLDPARPAAAIMRGTLPDQEIVEAPLAELAGAVAAAGLGSPAVVVIGDVVALRGELRWRETLPLFGMRVLITRPRGQAGEMARAVREVGGEPVCLPLIEIAPPDDEDALAAGIDALDSADAIVFASSNAVREFVRRCQERGAAERLRTCSAKVLCLGPRTADAARAAGLAVSLTANGRSAEALLDEITRSLPVAGCHVLLPRSDIGRNVLRDGLRAAGARVDAFEVYRTRPARFDAGALAAELAAGALPILTFTSPSAVQAFVSALDVEARAAVPHCVVGAIGRTTAAALREAGIEPDVVPERPDGAGLIEAVTGAVSHGKLRVERTAG